MADAREKTARRTGVRRMAQGALVGLAAAALAAALGLSGALDGFEGRSFDARVRLLARPAETSGRVALILLDQQSLDWGKDENGLSWPWPREVYTYIVNFCRRAGVRALAFDVLYSEPSTYGVYDDRAFAAAVGELGGFVAAIFPGEETGSATAWPADLATPSLAVAGLDRSTAGRQAALGFPRAAFPIPELAGAARVLANVNFASDADGIYRRGHLFNVFDGETVPSLALGAYLARSRARPAVRIDGRRLWIDDRDIPIDGEGRTILRYRGPAGTHDAYSAAAVIQSELQILSGNQPTLDPELLRDRYVFFGFSAPGLFDLRPTPVSGVYPGVEINATMLDNLLAGDFMRTAPAWLAVLAAVVLAVAAGTAASATSGAAGNVLVYVFFVPLPAALAVAAFAVGLWLPLMAPSLAVIVALAAAGLLNYATEGRQKRFIKGAFSQYLSPTVIEELIAQPDRLKLGGERRELSIFFSDLQGFTSLSEGLSPEDLTALLNEYLSAMTDIIQDEGGTIDKFEGDAIIAFWNAPLDQPDHGLRAVRAALRCQATLAAMRPGLRERVGKDLHKRIGINSGPAVVGNMGSRTRFDYTMLGDAVNLAARLEGINKQFGTYTMISASTLALLGGEFPARELSRVAVVGRKEPVAVYEPMQVDEYQARRATLERFAEGLAGYYRGEFDPAEAVFQSIAAEDAPAARYADRCRELKSAPPEQRDGVWVMTSK